MAGLTHGGFYSHFESRDDLIDQVFAKAMESSFEVWQRISDRADGGQCLASIVKFYLAERHRLDVGNGWALPALTTVAQRIVDQTLGSLSRNRCEGPGWLR
jgi:TetR/AcrR family transcriptional regulator, transcriptional repressor for nem operon